MPPDSSSIPLTDLVTRLAAEDSVPALGVTVFTQTEIVEQVIAGVRRSGEDTPVTLDDRFHLGSNTKAMTAALLGRLAERGILDFNTPLEQAFSNIDDMHPAFRTVTIRQLLSHTAGIDDTAFALDEVIDVESASLEKQRLAVADRLLSYPPAATPGSFTYSNYSYITVGAAIEQASGSSWENLMTTEVFEPLGMESCGFGSPGVAGEGDQPWGHDARNNPQEPGPRADNPAVFGPAGTVHCSMTDWVTFLQEMFRALDGSSDYLTETTASTIFTPVSQEYGLGWGVVTMSDETFFTHDGSNTLWYVSVILAPEKDIGWVTVTNASFDAGGAATAVVNQTLAEQLLEIRDE